MAKNKALEWATVWRKVNDLVPLSTNPRTITDAARMKLIESLKRFNLVDLPVVDNDNTVVSGHQRLNALQAIGRGNDEIEVRIPNRALTEKERKEYNLLANSHYGAFDMEALEGFADGLDLDGLGLVFDFSSLPDELNQSDNRLDSAKYEDDDFVEPENVAEIKTDIVRGDVFDIGEHRLMCGDSSNEDDTRELMDGRLIDMVFTSPPYNQKGSGIKKTVKSKGTIPLYVNNTDNKTKAGYFDFLINVFNCIKLFSKQDSAVFINIMYNANSRDDYGKIIFSEKNPFSVKETIIWDKKNAFSILAKGILSRRCELVFLMSLGDRYYTNQGDYEVRQNYWDISPAGAHIETHRACFPIGLPAKGIELCSIKSGLVYEPFCGSGTTMVAAHQLGRRCYGMEIEPTYCQIIIDRMLKIDPNLEIKKNGQPYQTKP